MLAAAVIALAAVVVYYVSLQVHPYTYCRRCQGGGRNAGSSRKRWGHCKLCGGSGRKERFGTRFLR
jgi:DnaJ-class molecular chaperone